MLINIAVSQADNLIIAIDETRYGLLREPFDIVQLPYTQVASLGTDYAKYTVETSESGQVSIRRASASVLEARAVKEANDSQQFLLEYILELDIRLSELEMKLIGGDLDE